MKRAILVSTSTVVGVAAVLSYKPNSDTAKTLLDRNPNPTEDQVRTAMGGNLCRCSAYKRILESVMAASRQMRA